MTAEKSRETRVRRMLARQGFALSRSRRRDPRAYDYGHYTISRGSEVVYGAAVGRTLDDCEQWAMTEDAARKAEAAPEVWEREGWVGVDTGRLMLADPAYPARMTEVADAAFGIAEDGIAGWSPHGQCIAVIISDFGGDGLYPVSVTRSPDGTIAAVRVDFTAPEDRS